MPVVLVKVTIVTKTCRDLGILSNYLTSCLKPFHVHVPSYWLACDFLKLYSGDITLIVLKA